MASLNKITGERVSILKPGSMYHYKYIADPKEKYFDRFPLVFVIQRKGQLVEGINFHYLDITRRLSLFTLMKRYFTTLDIEEETLLNARPFKKILLSSRKYRNAKVSYRRYLTPRIASKIIKVNPTEWENAIRLPTEKFIIGTGGKYNKAQVWKTTLIKSRK